MIDYKILHLTKEEDKDVPGGSLSPWLRWIYKINLMSTNIPREISGIEKLKQRIVMVLLTSSGTDIWEPEMGGGLMSMVGMSFSTEPNVLRNYLTRIVLNTEARIIEEQKNIVNLPADETLVSLELNRIQMGDRILEPIEVDWPNTSAFLRPTVTTAAGTISPLTIELPE